ncbi:hypothetical protein V1264_022261 [Littorina saxatilis]|uniref:Uncharacterized protein n=3 Tax=Littorina saxatilis TaxID=31220 RepID=A0AAN9AK43_9CAEN
MYLSAAFVSLTAFVCVYIVIYKLAASQSSSATQISQEKERFGVLALSTPNLHTYKLEATSGNINDTKNSNTHQIRAITIQPSNTPVSCKLMWEGNVKEINKGKFDKRNKPGSVTRKTLPDYQNATNNCTHYRQSGGFELASLSQPEMSFPLAFSIVVYRDADQVERLLSAIYRPHNVYCIHIDKKSARQYWDIMQLVASCLPNVFVSNVSVDVVWSGFTNLEPEIICMRQLWEHKVRWKYFINLTGQEFPLKTNKELVRILQAFRGANDITGDPTRFQHRWSQFLPAPYNLTIHKGDVHIVASRGFVDYVLHSHVGQALLEWVKPTAHPDESYFNTLNYNPQLGVPGSVSAHMIHGQQDSFARYKMWSHANIHPCGGTFVRHICQFGIKDLPHLASSSKLFANKFTFNYHPLAQVCILQWYRHKVGLEEAGEPLPINMGLYEQSHLVKNRYTGPVKIW